MVRRLFMLATIQHVVVSEWCYVMVYRRDDNGDIIDDYQCSSIMLRMVIQPMATCTTDWGTLTWCYRLSVWF